MLIQLWISDESLLVKLLIWHSINYYWNRSEYYIEELHHPVSIKVLALKARVETKNGCRSKEKQVFVDHVEDYVRVFAIALASMVEQEGLQLLELTNCIVRLAKGMITTLYTYLVRIIFDANRNVRLIHHGNIIDSISNSQRNFLWLIFFNQPYYVSFLTWRQPTSYQNTRSESQFHEAI